MIQTSNTTMLPHNQLYRISNSTQGLYPTSQPNSSSYTPVPSYTPYLSSPFFVLPLPVVDELTRDNGV